MKKTRILSMILTLAVLVTTLCGCTKTVTTTETTTSGTTQSSAAGAAETAETNGEWTIFVYLCASDLETDCGSATNDLMEMIKAQKDGNVRVVVETGGAKEWWNSTASAGELDRFLIDDDGIHTLDALKEKSMAKASTLQSFLKWGLENYRSENMAFIFWDHGGGSIGGVCYDETDDFKSLSLMDIYNTFSAVCSGKDFKFIGFDACLMGTLETANIVAPFADYLFASEENVSGDGWDYEKLLTYIGQNPTADMADIGREQCEYFYDSSAITEKQDQATFSIIDLSGLPKLIEAFDALAKDVYESGDITTLAREAVSVDNFGGNNRSEGYSNMIDMAALITGLKSISPKADAALEALQSIVVASKNGARHSDAGGLALYYPLSIRGSKEMSTLAEICPSTYYLALCDLIAYGSTGGDISQYDNSYIVSDSWDGTYSADSDVGENSGTHTSDELANCPIPIKDVFLSEDGVYTVYLENTDNLAYATCVLMQQGTNGGYVYLGEDDDVITNYESGVITDNFDGYWISLEGNILPIELVAQYGDVNVYTCSVFVNDEYTNLQIEYDWNAGKFKVLGTWDGINSENGMASRNVRELQNGDVLELVYYYYDADGNFDYFLGDPITVNGELDLTYGQLAARDYSYSIVLHDIYGGAWTLDSAVFTVDSNGEVWF